MVEFYPGHSAQTGELWYVEGTKVSGDCFCEVSSSILRVRDRRRNLAMVSKPPPPPVPFVPPDAPMLNRLPMSPGALNGLTVAAPVPAFPLGLPINEPSILNADGVDDDDDDNWLPPHYYYYSHHQHQIMMVHPP